MMKSAFVLCFFTVLLVACGFQLRGSELSALPYSSLYIALDANSEMYLWLTRYIQSLGTTEIVRNPESAEAIFTQIKNERQKNILSLDSQGRVKEYRLEVDYAFQVKNQAGEVIVPMHEITLTRDISHSDDTLLAKESEEAILWRDMYQDLSNQILRQLSLSPPQIQTEE